jgi:murein DD-endopeptidase MepM/ murein hydrolase activator NlpD
MDDLRACTPLAPAAAPAGRSPAAPSAAQVRTIAAEFESMLLGQLLRDMRASMFDDEEGSGVGTGPLAETVFAELSLALSRAGGLGIGQSLLGPLARETGIDAAAADTPAPAVDAPASTPAIATLGGRVSSGYGWRRDPIDGGSRFHQGVDIAMPLGQEIPAARSGRVTFAGELPGYGLTVVVAHDDRLATRYAHLSRLDVAAGAQVADGQVIGRSGKTGRATGPHLHFEALENGQPVDPAILLGRRR